MRQTSFFKRSAAYAALLLALMWLAPGLALADATAEPDSRWYLPSGHWTIMYCDYLIECDLLPYGDYVDGRYVRNCINADHFNGNSPVLLSDVAQVVHRLMLEIQQQQVQQDLVANAGAANAVVQVGSQVPPLRSIACDLAYEIYGLARARGLMNAEASPGVSEMQAQLARLQEVWTQYGNPAKPLAQAVPGDSHPETWCFEPAMVDSGQWAGLEVIGLIHYAMNASAAPAGSGKDASQTSVAMLQPADWTYGRLQELLTYTHSSTVERLYSAELACDKATALFDAAQAALRQMPALDSHIVLTAWDLGAELKRQPAAPDAQPDNGAVIADFGGLAVRCSVPINTGIPLSAYGDVPLSHWAYTALDELSQTPWLEGYPEGFFSSGRVLTMYEHAQAIFRLIDMQEDPGNPNRDQHLWLLTAELHAAYLHGLQMIEEKVTDISRHMTIQWGRDN